MPLTCMMLAPIAPSICCFLAIGTNSGFLAHVTLNAENDGKAAWKATLTVPYPANVFKGFFKVRIIRAS